MAVGRPSAEGQLPKEGALRAENVLHRMRWLTAVSATVVVVVLAGSTLLAVIYLPQLALYVPIIALGLALALQKYTASFFAHFVIVLTGIYNVGDRIRIGTTKGDVRLVGLLHTTLEEVGEDEKLGGELTGRLVHLPNLIILDQPVLNYSKDYSTQEEAISSDYIFDEVRIPITPNSNAQQACALLESILRSQDEPYMTEARQLFRQGYPKFLNEAMAGPRVLVHVEPQRIWIKGKFVAPLRNRNELRSRILLRFFEEISSRPDIKLA